MTAQTIVVARNPEVGSRLPYLLRLPLADGPLVLKARESWPRTAKVYCHRVVGGWPDDAEVLEEVPVRVCERRGVAIDLVLDPDREQRSQFVFTTVRGREVVFWQSALTARQARPGIRVPRRRAAGYRGAELEILVDTRERYPYRFAGQQTGTTRRLLRVGDYAVEVDGVLAAAVERKSLQDLAAGLVDGSLAFLLAELASLPRAAVVVEDRYSRLFKVAGRGPGSLSERADRILRDPAAGRGVHLPVPGRRARLRPRRPRRHGSGRATTRRRILKSCSSSQTSAFYAIIHGT
jgi:hypothetical protein